MNSDSGLSESVASNMATEFGVLGMGYLAHTIYRYHLLRLLSTVTPATMQVQSPLVIKPSICSCV